MPDVGSAPTKSFLRSDGTRTGSDLFQQEQAVAIDIEAINLDFEAQEMAVALTARLMVDGGNQALAALPMNGFNHTGVGVATARTHYEAASQAQDSTLIFAGTSAGTNTITATLTPAITAYVAGQRYHFKAGGTNTGATTIDFNSVGAKTVNKGSAGSTALAANDIVTGGMYTVEYDGTNMQLVNPGLARNVSAFAATILDDADAAAVRTTIGAQASGSYLVASNNLADLTNIPGAFINIKQAATTAATGVLQMADQAAQEAATTGRAVTSDVQHLHPSAAKAWVKWNGSTSTIDAGYNVSSITDGGPGLFTINFTVPFSSVNYAASGVAGGAINPSGRCFITLNPIVAAPAAGSFPVIIDTDAGGIQDGTYASMTFHGDQ